MYEHTFAKLVLAKYQNLSGLPGKIGCRGLRLSLPLLGFCRRTQPLLFRMLSNSQAVAHLISSVAKSGIWKTCLGDVSTRIARSRCRARRVSAHVDVVAS